MFNIDISNPTIETLVLVFNLRLHIAPDVTKNRIVGKQIVFLEVSRNPRPFGPASALVEDRAVHDTGSCMSSTI